MAAPNPKSLVERIDAMHYHIAYYLSALECAHYQISASEYSVLAMIFHTTISLGRPTVQLSHEEIASGVIRTAEEDPDGIEWEHGGTGLTLPTVRRAMETLICLRLVYPIKKKKGQRGNTYQISYWENVVVPGDYSMPPGFYPRDDEPPPPPSPATISAN